MNTMKHRFRVAVLLASAALAAPAGGQEVRLSLAEAVEAGLENNPMLRAARSDVDAARGRLTSAAAGFLPSVRITEGWIRTNDAVGAFGTRLRQERFSEADFAVSSLNGPAAITNFETRLEVRQPIFNGGRSLAQRGQAAAGLEAARAMLSRAEQQVAFDIARAYWGCVLARDALAATRQGVAAASAGLRLVEAHHAEGTVPRSDLLAARVRLAEVEAEEAGARARVETAREGLGLLLGLPLEASPSAVDSLVDPGSLSDPGAFGDAVSRRPDLRAQERATEAARLAVKASRAGWIPHVNAFLDAALDADRPLARDGERWTAGAVLSWDLFSGGRTVGAYREASARARSAQARLDFARSRAEREIRQAVRDYETARTRMALASAVLAQSEERHRITQLSFREGLATTADLLGAEAALTGARVERTKTLYDVNVGAARLALASGRPPGALGPLSPVP